MIVHINLMVKPLTMSALTHNAVPSACDVTHPPPSQSMKPADGKPSTAACDAGVMKRQRFG
jgi:hypothetical protein